MEPAPDSQERSIRDRARRAELIDEAMLEGARRALLIHHKLGQDVVTWRDGKIAIVSAAELLADFDAVAASAPGSTSHS
jgi:hypothetical protein